MKTQIIVALLAVLLLSGCGKSEKKYTLTGTVTYQGKLVERGSVSFVPVEAGKHSDGAEIVDGKYTCEVTPGEKIVRITGSRQVPPPKGDNPSLVLYEDFIPSKFNRESELQIDVTGAQTKDFQLE